MRCWCARGSCGGGKALWRPALDGRVDSFVVETDVHYPTDVNLLWNAMRVLLTEVSVCCGSHGVSGWRQGQYWRSQVRQGYQRVSRARLWCRRPKAVAAWLTLCGDPCVGKSWLGPGAHAGPGRLRTHRGYLDPRSQPAPTRTLAAATGGAAVPSHARTTLSFGGLAVPILNIHPSRPSGRTPHAPKASRRTSSALLEPRWADDPSYIS